MMIGVELIFERFDDQICCFRFLNGNEEDDVFRVPLAEILSNIRYPVESLRGGDRVRLELVNGDSWLLARIGAKPKRVVGRHILNWQQDGF